MCQSENPALILCAFTSICITTQLKKKERKKKVLLIVVFGSSEKLPATRVYSNYGLDVLA